MRLGVDWDEVDMGMRKVEREKKVGEFVGWEGWVDRVG